MSGSFNYKKTRDGRADMTNLEMDLFDTKMGLHTSEAAGDDGDEVPHFCRKSCLRPACFPIMIIVVFVIMVVLFPVIKQEFSGELALWDGNGKCRQDCRFTLVESIPENLTFIPGSPIHLSTYNAWKTLLNLSRKSIDIAAAYWTLRGKDIYQDPSDWQGEDVFRHLVLKGREGLQIRIAQNIPGPNQSLDSAELAAERLATVKNLNFTNWFGSGILHTKLWIVDNEHFYVGSANMDWRSLTQVKELGALVTNCSCLVSDLRKIFDVYWYISDLPRLPRHFSTAYWTHFNAENPMVLNLNGSESNVYFSSSPSEICPKRREPDLKAILNVIGKAEKFIHIAVMDYDVATLYSKQRRYWPVIDDALRSAAYNRGIHVKLLCSKWEHTHTEMYGFLKSLTALNPALTRANGSIEVKLFQVPSFTPQQRAIPFARVNHNKYMVTDNTAYIGTSNWAGDYFISTGGVGLVIRQSGNGSLDSQPIVGQLQAVFTRDWSSHYAFSLFHYDEREESLRKFGTAPTGSNYEVRKNGRAKLLKSAQNTLNVAHLSRNVV